MTVGDLRSLACGLNYPILIKPRTHIHRVRNDKGVVIHSADELVREYQLFLAREQTSVLADNPLIVDARRPLLQKFVDVSRQGVLSVTGFIDRKHELFVTRHSIKVFQRSYPVGVGVCFVSAPPVDFLLNSIRRLCVNLRYFGIFEIEFVHYNGQWAVIDFNPRLFNQIALDIRRGMPLPLLACLDAANETAALREAVARAQAWQESDDPVLYDWFTLNAILLARMTSPRTAWGHLRYWREWLREHAGRAIDIAQDANDPIPGLIHVFSEICLGLKAIPRFLRSTSRTSSPTKQLPARVPS